MKILLLTRLYNPFSGGAATEYKFYHDSFLKKSIAQHVTIITCNHKSKPFFESNHKSKVIRTIINFQNQHSLILKILSFLMSSITLILTFFYLLLFNKKFDIIQIHSDFLFLKKSKYINFFVLIFKILSKKSILDIKDLSSFPKKDIGFDYYLVNSINTFELVKKYIPNNKIKLIYSPIIFKSKNKKAIKIKNRLIFIGSISQEKGVNELLNAIKILYKKKINYKLYLYGELQTKFEFSNNSYFKGPIPHQKVIEQISKAELLILPSYSESLPRVIIEAMLHNTKVLVSKCTPELNNTLEAHNLLDFIDSKEIAHKIENLLTKKIYQKYKYNFEIHNNYRVIKDLGDLYKL